MTYTTCSHCHAENSITAIACRSCGHDANAPRIACRCEQCSRYEPDCMEMEATSENTGTTDEL